MNKLTFAGVAGALLLLSAAPASASFGLFCQGKDIDIEIPMAGVAGLHPLGATIKVAEKTWTMEEGAPGTIQILPAQAASVDDRLYLDFMDGESAAILVEIRLFWAEEETDPIYGGTLRIAGAGAWPISCGMG
jgi:hypothetical protein